MTMVNLGYTFLRVGGRGGKEEGEMGEREYFHMLQKSGKNKDKKNIV